MTALKGRRAEANDSDAWRVPVRLQAMAPAPGPCNVPLCGAVADDQDERELGAGWVRTCVYGSADPDRVWCSGTCATFGIALGELRVRGTTS